jgi:hypothetical protein
MTISLKLSEIADAISQIAISGVTVKDKNEVSGSWVSLPNVLYPNPDGWVTGFGIEYATVMQGATAPMDISYTLNYRLLGVQVGDLALMPVSYSALVDKLVLVLNAMISAHAPYTGRVEMKVGDIGLGARTDPAGNQYYGADIALNIMEMQN